MLQDISIAPFANIQSALDEAVKLKGSDARVLIVNDAGVAVPVVGREESS
jgi:hypothetical protein